MKIPINNKRSDFRDERGSLPGLAAVLLVIVVLSIGVTSSTQLPDPGKATKNVQGLIEAVGGSVVIGALLNPDGSMGALPAGEADPDYVQSVNNLRSAIGGLTAGPETACVGVVRSRPNANCTAFSQTIVTQDPTSPLGCGPVPGICSALALAQRVPGDCRSQFYICIRTFGDSPQTLIVPAGTRRVSFNGVL